MGRQNYLRNSGIQLVLLLLVGLTLRSIYSDVTYFRNEWEFKKYIQSLNVNSYRSGYWSNKPSDAGPCEPSDDRPCERQDQVHTTSTEREENKVIPNDTIINKLRYGGFYKPRNFVSREKTAIIIPYRDRVGHLETTLDYLHMFLQKQQIQYEIFVVEMALPTQFNRGLLANAGFLTAHRIGNFSCYIIHDVDLLPTNSDNLYRCGEGPRHLITNCTKYNNSIPYRKYVGGVLAMTKAHFMAVNGYSNLYFGWGGEDDDMSRRINASNLVLERPKAHIGTYVNLNHMGDSSNPRNPHKFTSKSMAKQRQKHDGLSSIKFQRLALEFREKYTWILIKANEKKIMASYPHLTAKFDITIEQQEANKEANKRTNIGVKKPTKIKRNRSKLLHRRKVKFGHFNT